MPVSLIMHSCVEFQFVPNDEELHSRWTVFGLSGTQSSYVTDAVTLLLVVGGQLLHASFDCETSLNVPTAQADGTLPVYPASAKQAALEEEAVLPPVPELVGQRMHVSEACAAWSLYFPATQLMQLSEDCAAWSLYLPARQSSHED